MIKQFGSTTMRAAASIVYGISRAMEKVGNALITDSAKLDSNEPPAPIKDDGTADTSPAATD